jgi:hypothetical protein
MKKAIEISQENKAGIAILSSGLACLIFGVSVILCEISLTIKEGLQWVDAVGPLSGKVGISILSWSILWIVLHKYVSNKPPIRRILFSMGLVLILLSFLFTFPPFFSLFA